ncbi:MAG: hypothetical protein ABSD72_03030 [Terracidiphilus sp.]|jgi:hypothetical protein
MSKVNERNHKYNAETMVLSGQLVLPVSQKIEPQAHTKLPENGGYFSQRLDGYRLESVVTFRSGYSHTAGCLSDKPGGGHTTLTTTVVEGLNVLEVLTADRVVGQTITEHPLEGYMPSISFLGTRFENLRIAGFPVKMEFDYDIFGPRPVNDLPYAKDGGVVSRVSRQYDRILRNKNLPDTLQKHYNDLSSKLGSAEDVECSLVNRVGGFFPGSIFGNVITVPGFGTITLAKLTVKHENPHETTKVYKKTTFTLTMIDLKLGCVIAGDIPIGGGTSNGGTLP